MIASLPVQCSEMSAASWPEESVAELKGCSAKVRLAYHQQRTPAMQKEAAIDFGALNRRVADLDPKTAPRPFSTPCSRVGRGLGFAAEPNTGTNGVHASASPFEALAERANWLGMPLESDSFGRAMLATGVRRGASDHNQGVVR